MNPRKIKRPIVKKWCYTPKIDEGSAESDLNETTNDTTENDSENTDEETTLSPDDNGADNDSLTAPPRRG